MSSVIGPSYLTAHLAMKHPVLAVAAIGTMALLSWGEANPDKGYVVFTFDDGHVSDYTTSYPKLLDAGFPATFYLTLGNIGQPGFLSWPQINIMTEWEKGWHTISHPDLTQLSDDQLASEIGIATEDHKTFASPFGYYGDRELEAIAAAGYTGHVNAWSEQNGINELPVQDPFDVHRFTVRSDMTIEEVCAMAPAKDQALVLVLHSVVPEDEIASVWQISDTMLDGLLECFEGYNTTTVSRLLEIGKEKI